MSTIDTSTWSPDSDLNVDIGGIPLNADAGIAKTWRAIQMLMAALKGDTSDIKLTINQPDGTTIVATNQTLSVVDNGHAHIIANVAGLQTALGSKADDSTVVHASNAENIDGVKTFKQYIRCDNSSEQRGITGTSSATSFLVGAANSVNSGAHVQLYGKDNSSNAGSFAVTASIGSGSSNRKALQGTASGTLSWDGQAIQTSSDERLKTPLSAVPDEVLDAWEDVNWGQFQFLEAVQEKGGHARLHLGLIAQKVKAVFEARGLDACVYGILCHDEKDDLWMVRYEEALVMEAALQRRRADRLETRIAALEEVLHG